MKRMVIIIGYEACESVAVVTACLLAMHLRAVLYVAFVHLLSSGASSVTLTLSPLRRWIV